MFYQSSVLSEFEEKGLTLQEALDALDTSKIESDREVAEAYLELHMIVTGQLDSLSLKKHYEKIQKDSLSKYNKFKRSNKVASEELFHKFKADTRNSVNTIMAIVSKDDRTRNTPRMSITGKEVFK